MGAYPIEQRNRQGQLPLRVHLIALWNPGSKTHLLEEKRHHFRRRANHFRQRWRVVPLGRNGCLEDL